MDEYPSYCLLPEWAPQQAVLLSLPHPETDWAYMLPDVLDCYRGILVALSDGGTPVHLLCPSPAWALETMGEDTLRGVTLHEVPTDDTWVRDYGPLTVRDEGTLAHLDFGFNGWGLKFAASRDNLVNLRLARAGFLRRGYSNQRDFILEGGSVESDGRGTILTTTHCLCSPNRNGGLGKLQLERVLLERLGATHVLWLDHGALAGDDTDSHIDTLARLAPGDTIIYVGCRDRDDEHFTDLQLMAEQLRSFTTYEGNPFNLVELPLPRAIFDPDDGTRLPATYANYLLTNRKVLVPAYGQEDNDTLARRIIQSVFPRLKAESVDCRALIRQHGSLHCATMQIPESV